MNGFPRATWRLPALLPLMLALSPAAATAEQADADAAASARESYRQAQAFEQAIGELEAQQGAYGPALAEPVTGLALALQSQGRHEEAVALFKRSIHLTRINEGLHSPAQLPPLQGEIASLKALRHFDQVDERESYLFQLQQRSLDGDPALTAAYLRQAQWQFEAYQLGLEGAGYPRLMTIWELYRRALNDIIDREGEQSPALLPPLEGMLRTQYLIADYGLETAPLYADDDFRARQQLLQFSVYQAQSYDKGNAVLETMRKLAQAGVDGADRVRALVLQGDWHMWHNRQEAAREAYAAALAELGTGDAAQAQAQRWFGEPVPLPDLDGLRPLPPAVDPADGDVTLEFAVSERGRAADITRLDDHAEQDGAANRLMRTLRQTRFRPRFVDGQPGETDKLVKAYQLP